MIVPLKLFGQKVGITIKDGKKVKLWATQSCDKESEEEST